MNDPVAPSVLEEERQEAEIEFSPDWPQEKLIAACRELIERAQKRLLEENPDASGRAVCARFSRFHDALLRAIFKHVSQRWELAGKGAPGSLCLVALGGYGRRELSLRSDVDLLLLVGDPKGQQEAFVKEFIYILFDLKLDLGYVVRRLEDCLLVIGTDIQSTTAMMESRWLAGSRPLFQHYHEIFYRTLRGRGRKWFLQALYREWQGRHQKYDDSIYLIQPNIKESSGGLRDINSVRWALNIVKGTNEFSGLEDLGILTAAEVRDYRHDEDFILRLRNELHALAPRKNDVLNFDSQIEITRKLGYQPSENLLAEEVLMREYYRRAREIAKFSNRAFLTLMRGEKSSLGALIGTLKTKRVDKFYTIRDGAIDLASKNVRHWTEDPARIMALFARAQRLGLRVGEQTRDLIEKIVPDLTDEFRESPVCRKQFLELMRGPFNVARTLADMHDCGFLCAYFPEFERIHCMVRMDHYHRYTVDEHLIKAVECNERLLREPSEPKSHAAQIASQIERRDLLNLSLLLHDVGKGFGKGHALLGGQIVQRIGQRIGLEADEIETLRFLVLSHLKIGHVAQRRNVEDPKVGRDLAEEVGTLDRLKLLYVHSVCDSMAVSPDSWSSWKATLFESCYRAGELALEGKGDESPKPEHYRSRIADRIWEHILAHPPEDLPRGKEEREHQRRRLEEFLESVPDRYLQVIRAETIAKHFWLMGKLDEGELIQWSLDPGLSVSELAVCSADIPGSFAKICGALAAREINICSAQIFSTSAGYGINVFQITDLENRPLSESFRLERLRADLNQVLLGKKTMEELIEKHKGDTLVPRPTRTPRKTEIRMDNDGSQEFTILEVRTGDRPGLLYQIASVLDAQKLNIDRAMVSTEAYGVMDVFYVTDLEFNKIHDPLRIERIEKELIQALDDPSSPPKN